MLKHLLEVTNDDMIGQVSLPPRTPYYGLPPIGMGTWAAEGTTSYVARLAAKHCVHVKDFVIHALKAKTCRAGTSWDLFPRQKQTFRLNGIGSYAKEWPHKLAELTGQRFLHGTNFSRLQKILPPEKLIREKRAWCYLCLREMQKQNVYEPLLWSLHHAEACPIHRVRLSTSCPSCKAYASAPLSPHYVPGHCIQCKAWLGEPSHDEVTPLTGWEVWISFQLGALIAALSSSDQSQNPTAARDNIQALIQSISDGNMTRFAGEIDASKSTCSTWVRGKALPTLDYWIRISWISGIDVGKLIFGTITPQDPNLAIRGSCKQSPWKQRPKRRIHDWDYIGKCLADIFEANETPPRGLPRIAKQMGVDTLTLKKRFPDLCQQLARRNTTYWTERPAHIFKILKDRVERAVVNIIKDGHLPTRRRVARELSLPGGDIFDRRLQQVWRSCVAKLSPAQPR